MMFPPVSREQTQLISLILVTTGLAVLLATPHSLAGVAFIGLSCWSLMISESALHDKVQKEMSIALERLRKRQEADIQDLLYFLRDAQISSQPFDSMDGAKRLCSAIGYPAMVVTPHHQIIKANDHMHNLLGWDSGKLNGTAAHVINDPIVMSTIGEIMSRPENVPKKSMITKYVYRDIREKKIYGQLDVHAISGDGVLEGFFAVFHPEDCCMISSEEIRHLTSN